MEESHMSKKVVIIGQGYVGLPIAMTAVEADYDVVGLDSDQRRIDRLTAGESFVEDVGPERVSAALATGRYIATTDYRNAGQFDVAVITVPTPLRETLPDLSFIESSAASLAPHIHPGCLVVFESTTYPGTTDELLQWVSCKWGLDEDIVRGIVAKESWWRDNTLGDLTGDSSVCAYGHSIGSDGQAGVCPQSIGLAQINYQYYRDGFPAAAESNAYHLDYALAVWRSCYEGAYTWLNNVDKGATYGAGDAWGCVGFWNAGRWHTAKGEGYVAEVKDYINQRIWEQPRFQEA